MITACAPEFPHTQSLCDLCAVHQQQSLCALCDLCAVHQHGVDDAVPPLPAAHSLDAAVMVPQREVGLCPVLHKLPLPTRTPIP